MKTIKIFLASSEELDYDRMAFGNLVRRLDDMYEKRGIRIKLFEWEDYDSAYNDRRKQDEYNEYVCQSDIFLALFHKKAGQFTIEEFDKASEQFKATASPKVYTFCKDLKPGEEESPELKEFKERLFNEMGHYWCRYDNRESLQFQFVMQLQLVESNRMDDVKVEDGIVSINGLPVAKMENLKFAAANEDYIKMQTEIQELSKEIIGMQIELEEKQKTLDAIKKTPNNEALYKYIKNDVDNLIDKLQPKLNKKNKLKEDFAKLQQNFFDTAKRVAQLQGEHITNRLRDAINAFNEGRVHDCNLILNIAKEDARRDYDDFKQCIEIAEVKRQNVISHITEKLFHASSILADAIIPIEERIQSAEELYEEAYNMADDKHVKYSTDNFIDLLSKYSSFLSKYAHYDKAIEVYKRLTNMCEMFYGKEHPNTAESYNGLGLVYDDLGDYDKALEYHKQALNIREKILGKEHPDTAMSYNNIGNVYYGSRKYKKAIDFHKQALNIRENVLGKEHPDTAISYLNIGNIYYDRMNYDKALEYYKQALDIQEKVLGREHLYTAHTFNNIGVVYNTCGDYVNAVDYLKHALDIKEIVLGKEHPDTTMSYNNIGNVYSNLSDYEKATYYYKLAAEQGHDIAQFNLGDMYENGKGVEQSYTKAAEWYCKAAEQGNHEAQRQLGYLYDVGLGVELNKIRAAELYRKAGYVDPGLMYETERNYEKAIEWYVRAAKQGDVRAQYSLGRMYIEGKGVEQNYVKAAEWYCNAAEQGYKRAYNELAWNLHLTGKYEEALPWAEKAVKAFPQNPNIIDTLASVYQDLGRYDEALEQFELCLKLYKEQENSEDIHETEAKITELKELMKNGGVSEQ